APSGPPHHRRRDRTSDPAGQPGARHGQDRVRQCRVAQQRSRYARIADSGRTDNERDVPRTRRNARADDARTRANAPGRLGPTDAGTSQPAVECGQVRAGRRRSSPDAIDKRREGYEGRGAGQRPWRHGGAAGIDLREVPPGRRCCASATGDRPGPADQPPDRRTFRRTPLAAFHTGPRRVFRLRTTVEPRRGARFDRAGSNPMSRKILIADDEPNILISLEYLMKREGYAVIVARDGAEALATVRRERPVLVLLDVMMPGKTGCEVCQELRADEELKDTLVLMLTAKGRDTDVAKGLALGANDYITKPFSTKELVQKVRELLATKT